MTTGTLSAGVVHAMPGDLGQVLAGDPQLRDRWEDLTPLARNEWLCWVEDAKKAETRQKRIGRLTEDLHKGKRRPCCWPGCKHRARTGKP